jgi:hypothetical protein
MRKYLLLAILFVTIVLGCGKNIEPEPKTAIVFDDGEELIINDYLSKKDLELYTNYIIGNDSNFYAYGFKDNKLYIKEFKKQTKQNIWSFVSKTNFPIGNTVTIDEGYGVIKTYKLIGFSVREILKYENNYALVIDNQLEGSGSCYLFNLFIVSNGNESLIDIKSMNPNIYSRPVIRKWFENSFLLSYTNNLVSAPYPIIQCYSYSGNLLYETQYVLENGIYLILNFDEWLLYTNNYFKRYNLKENKEIWKSKVQTTLPPNVRIDFQGFEIIDKDFTKYTINYTTYEGDKKAIAFKINNNTGEYVQL